MPKKKIRPAWTVLLLIGLGSLLFALLLANTEIMRSLELDMQDLRFRLRGPLVMDSPVVLIAIDDQSDESTPERWPWPREYFARVIANLERAGAAVIGVDVIFDEPDRHGSRSDSLFASVLSRFDNVVLAGKMLTRRGRYESTVLVPPYEAFVNERSSWGLVSTDVDEDGIFRNYLLSQEHLDSTALSFALEVLRIYRGAPRGIPVKQDKRFFILGQDTIPKSGPGAMKINFMGPAYTFPVYSFDNILDDREFTLVNGDVDAFDDPGDEELGIPPGLLYSGVLKGKVALIGATMKELHDDFPTPFLESVDESGNKVKAMMPGVEIHANAFQTILSRRFITEMPFFIHLLLLACACCLTAAFVRFLPVPWASACTLVLAGAYCALSFLIFIRKGMFLDITSFLSLVLLAFTGNYLYQYFLSLKEKRMIQGAFSHYVPEKVVSAILENPDMLTLGGEERILTVLFSDLEHFTSIAESMTPSGLVTVLNEYLTAMCEIILTRDGIIDKFEGDAIMAEFGVPVPSGSHAQSACMAAVQMQKKLAEMRKEWQERQKPALRMRIGLNTGPAIVGNMGSRDVFDYTVIGDSVNLGSRLESANKYYRTEILISAFTRDQIGDAFIVRRLDTLRVKGKAEPVTIYELLGTKEQDANPVLLELIRLYETAWDVYSDRRWKEAVTLFGRCIELAPEDGPSLRFLELCRQYAKKDPGPGWEPVTVLTEK